MSTTTNRTVKFLTTAQAAERLGIDESQVRRHCRAGKLGMRLSPQSRAWIIAENELAKFAKAERKPGRKVAPKKSRKKS